MREGLSLATLEIDGSRGEGGGQILRSSLALAMITQRPIRVTNIRARRAKPGLRRQHLAAVQAAARLCNALVHGAAVSSQTLEFAPGPITGGHIDIDIGTAGSTTLVVQTLLVPAIHANVALHLTVTGGTHNPLAPPFEFLDRVFAPHLRAMGADVTLVLDRHGFANGGRGNMERDERDRGKLTVTVLPGASALRPLELVDAPPVSRRCATAILARLPTHVADREHAVVRERLGFSATECAIREVPEGGPANVLLLEIERGSGRELVTGYGEQGLRAETVAQRACDALAAFLAADVPVGEHLADQLLLPMALAPGSRFRTLPLSLHATTNIETIQRFLDIPIRVEPAAGGVTVAFG